MIRFLPFLLVFFWAARVAAQDAPAAPNLPPGTDRITSVQEGGRAPYAGMLLDTDTAIRWTNKLLWWPTAFRLHLAQDVEELAARDRSAGTELRIVQESLGREITGLRTDLREAVTRYERELASYRDPPFWETWGFAFGMGALALGVIVGVAGGLVLSL